MSETDLISRQQAIDALKQIGSIDTNADREYAEKVFMALPSAQRWIPVSEALPDMRQIVLITNSIGNVRCGQYRGIDFECNGIQHWIWKGNTCEPVTAWMPLPEPWKGGQDE